jgi:hypothetical protein
MVPVLFLNSFYSIFISWDLKVKILSLKVKKIFKNDDHYCKTCFTQYQWFYLNYISLGMQLKLSIKSLNLLVVLVD